MTFRGYQLPPWRDRPRGSAPKEHGASSWRYQERGGYLIGIDFASGVEV
jgi:hypothetical protein